MLNISTDDRGAALDEQQTALIVQNKGLNSLSLANRQYSEQVLQPDLLQQVLTNCTSLTQLMLTSGAVDDQGLEVLLTHGTSITDLTLYATTLTSSKAERACSWHRLTLLGAALQQLAYLPLKSVQELHTTTGHFVASGQRHRVLHFWNAPDEQLPYLLHQATTNPASCPAWVKAPPSELTLSGSAQYLTSDQRLQLLQALAPVAGRHVSKLRLSVRMQLGQAEVEAIASSFPDSLTSLHLDWATLHDSFWKSVAEHFPSLQQLWLGDHIRADAMDLAEYLAMSSRSVLPRLDVNISPTILNQQDSARLQARINEWGLENIRFRGGDDIIPYRHVQV
jgi:hypothetical protein